MLEGNLEQWNLTVLLQIKTIDTNGPRSFLDREPQDRKMHKTP